MNGEILPNIPRFYTALAEWLACMQCILEMKPRVTGVKFAGISAAFLIFQSSFLMLTEGLDGFLWILCMITAVASMYLFICLCGNVGRKSAGYYCVRAFVVAEFAASLEWQIDCWLVRNYSGYTPILRIALLVAIFGAVYAVIWSIYRACTPKGEKLNIQNRELISYVIIGSAVFLVSNLGFVSSKTPFSSTYAGDIFNIRTMVDLGGVAILYAYHVQRMELRVRYELESVQNILHNQLMQYQQSQKIVELINYRYHDLKNHIVALRSMENGADTNQYLDQMEADIRDYEAWNKTGNKILDTLLTAKHLQCLREKISMTCVVDGTLFDFMDAVDICSIFGNALDNAIEYEIKIPNEEKRLIHITAVSQKSFLIIRIENYCEDTLTFQNKLPITTKKEAQFHGYGLKSLRYTVKKYGGEVKIDQENSWFILKILIPLPAPPDKKTE